MPSGYSLNALTHPETLPNLLALLNDEKSKKLLTQLTSKSTIQLQPPGNFPLKRATLLVSNNSANGRPYLLVSFPASERPSDIADYLFYHINVPANDELSNQLEISLNDVSRVAGYSLAGLKGKHGPLTIDNKCIVKRLNSAVNDGLLKMTSTAIGGGSSDGGNSNGGGNSGGGCSIVEFSQGGQLLYIFRICEQ